MFSSERKKRGDNDVAITGKDETPDFEDLGAVREATICQLVYENLAQQ